MSQAVQFLCGLGGTGAVELHFWGTLRVTSSLFIILQRMSQAVQVLCGLGDAGAAGLHLSSRVTLVPVG